VDLSISGRTAAVAAAAGPWLAVHALARDAPRDGWQTGSPLLAQLGQPVVAVAAGSRGGAARVVAADARGADDLLRGLAEDWPTPIALDESLASGADIERWIGEGWRGVWVVKTSLLRDVAGVLAQLEKAQAQVVFSSALETSVGAKAALQWAMAWPGEPRALGFGVWPLFQDTRCDGPYVAPFIRPADVARIDTEAVWNAIH
jgi:O-succinylbenzoate synthase